MIVGLMLIQQLFLDALTNAYKRLRTIMLDEMEKKFFIFFRPT